MSFKHVKNILFCVNGYGLGNATRVQAIIDELNFRPQAVNITILATDLAIDFFKSESPEHRLIAYNSHYLKNASPWSFIKDVRNLDKLITKQIKELNIDVIVTNSIYPLRPPKNLTFLALNNSHSNWKYFHKALYTLSLKSYFIEFLDFVYHQMIPDETLYLDLRCELPSHNILPPISRKAKRKKRTDKILLLPGGGNELDDSFLRYLPPEQSYVTYAPLGTSFSLDIERREPSYNVFEELSSFKLVICAGGLSSLSEVQECSTPAIIIPQKRHHEQYMNAYHLSKKSPQVKLIDHSELQKIPEAIEELTSLPLCQQRHDREYRSLGVHAVIKKILSSN